MGTLPTKSSTSSWKLPCSKLWWRSRNSQGGSLLIGANDDGDVVGLDHDYVALGDVDRDGFELHLRNLLDQAVGAGFVASNVSVTFPQLGDALICRVVVRPATAPLFLRTVGKDSQAAERFYVRSGNSSQEISRRSYPRGSGWRASSTKWRPASCAPSSRVGRITRMVTSMSPADASASDAPKAGMP
jgi:hypothetical protein